MSKNKKQSLQSAHQKPLLKRMWEHKVLYLMILPCLLFFLIFNYIPSSGIQRFPLRYWYHRRRLERAILF